MRTLLLNRTATSQEGAYWTELVPSQFYVRSQSPAARIVREALFGTTPDSAMLNYRLMQIMPLLHVPGIEEHTINKDRRVTYIPWRTHDPHESAYTPRVTLFSPTVRDIAILGELTPDMARGRLVRQWHIAVIAHDTVRVTKLTAPTERYDVTFTVTASRSSAIPLRGSGSSLTFIAEVGDSWMLDTLTRPKDNLADIEAALREQVTEPHLITLFGVNPAEPVRTWRNLWLDHPYWQYRLAGLLLAVADDLERSGRDPAYAVGQPKEAPTTTTEPPTTTTQDPPTTTTQDPPTTTTTQDLPTTTTQDPPTTTTQDPPTTTTHDLPTTTTLDLGVGTTIEETPGPPP